MVEKIKSLRLEAFLWRESLSALYKIGLCFGMALCTGLLAGIRVPLAFTPIPITGQVLGVLLSGIFLGRFYGGLSMAIYLLLGLSGIPWFKGWSIISFSAFFANPTSGYLIGFIFASLFIGSQVDRKIKNRFFLPQLGLMLLGILIIYIFGASYLFFLTRVSFSKIFIMAILPFIPGDILKVFLAVSISASFLPKKSYNGEMDKNSRKF